MKICWPSSHLICFSSYVSIVLMYKFEYFKECTSLLTYKYWVFLVFACGVHIQQTSVFLFIWAVSIVLNSSGEFFLIITSVKANLPLWLFCSVSWQFYSEPIFSSVLCCFTGAMLSWIIIPQFLSRLLVYRKFQKATRIWLQLAD